MKRLTHEDGHIVLRNEDGTLFWSSHIIDIKDHEGGYKEIYFEGLTEKKMIFQTIKNTSVKMSECYQIIVDEKKVLEFIEWLPDCQEHEQFYFCLFMRKKYCPDVPWIKSDKGQLKRGLTNKERLMDKIAQLEVKVGAYKFDNNPVPQESLACYIGVNPRDLYKAIPKSIKALATLIECQGKTSNPHQEVMSEIQRTPSKRTYTLFDLDWKDDKLLEDCMNMVDKKCDVIETRGGYHLHVHKDKIDQISDKMWYNKLKQHADVCGDALSPICGTYQGGFVPTFIYRYED